MNRPLTPAMTTLVMRLLHEAKEDGLIEGWGNGQYQPVSAQAGLVDRQIVTYEVPGHGPFRLDRTHPQVVDVWNSRHLHAYAEEAGSEETTSDAPRA